MTKKENNLLKIMLLIMVLGLMLKGLPFAYQKYLDRKHDISALKDKKSALKALMSRAGFWQVEFDKSIQQQQQHEKELFTAKSNELVAAKVQSVIKKLAKQSGLRVESMRLAEFQQSGNWLLVSLSITIKANSTQLIQLLKKIKVNKQKLLIKEISIRSYRKLLNGSITLVAFSKSESLAPTIKEAE